ncbi:DUF2834 domain-containing protein [Sphingomonas montanisoli]|uniref:DUF2834 domain-containing protein n=1 Tax=Sphingomonas montanisoli TaxID=2606412 RepID=A0A5D9C4C0_9SPHN|nr:DUF2834 domain-containing protein [Sphingomonas montanisoli]TZG26604.1 DUF2834 domain-containing protein [Sphingomonas montanisoli]
MFGIYLALSILGAILPLSAFAPWFVEHGLDLPAFVAELFSTRIGAFFGWDVIVTALVLFVLIAVEGARAGVRHRWLPIFATLAVGVSCGLPLFLALRERALRGGRDFG